MRNNSKIGYLVPAVAFVFSINCFATPCQKPVISLFEYQPAPCTGYLFSPEKEKEVRLMNEDYKLATEEIELLDKQVALYKSQQASLESIIASEKQRADLWETKANDYATKFIKERDKSDLSNILYFSLGIVTTILISWSVGQIHK